MSFIGASLSQVRDAIKRKKMRFASSKVSKLNEIRGAGTRKLSKSFLKTLARQWWNSRPGTKFVIGWIHSNALRYQKDGGRPRFRIATVSISRPTNEEAVRMMGNQFNPNDPTSILKARIKQLVREADGRLRYIENINAVVGPVWKNGDDGIEYGVSPFFVWPGGIIENNRLSNAANKLETIQLKRMQEAEKIRYRISWMKQMINLAYFTRHLGQGGELMAQHWLKSKLKPFVRRKVDRMRNEKARQAHRTGYADVMAELRAIPRGTIHRAFPGGSNYHASLKRLRSLTVNNGAPNKSPKRRRV